MDDKEPLIDTNVLVHAYVLSDEKKHTIAKDFVQNIWNNGGGVTTLQNVSEFFFVVTKKVEKPMLASKAKVIATHLIKIHPSGGLLIETKHLTTSYPIGGTI